MSRKDFAFEDAVEEIDQDVGIHINTLQKLNGLRNEVSRTPDLSVVSPAKVEERHVNIEDSHNTRNGLPRPQPGTRISPEIGVTISVKVGISYKQRLDQLAEARRSQQLYPWVKRDLVEEALASLFDRYDQ